MGNIDIYLDSIHEAYPDLKVEKVRAHPHDGQFNDILIINEELIFRFPRFEENIPDFVSQVRLLQYIQGSISLLIPNPIYSSTKSTTTNKIFMGYRMVPGEHLTRGKLAAIRDDTILQRLADQLARFLSELHSIPVTDLENGLPVQDGPEAWAELYTEIQQHLFHFMRSGAKARVRDHFEAYLNNPGLHRYRICLRHGDFGPGNILYNPEDQTISGVIDFDGMGLGDPAIDIAAASCYGEAFTRRFRPAYPEVDSMMERTRFYKGTFALQEALHGFKNKDNEAFQSGMAEYV